MKREVIGFIGQTEYYWWQQCQQLVPGFSDIG
jgi:hypothetical protein